MRKLVIVAAVVVAAAGSVNCGSSPNGDILSSPSALADSTLAGTDNNGKHGPGTPTSGLTLAMVTDANSDGAPNHGDQVTFNITTNETTNPQVSLTCSQNGVLVYNSFSANNWTPIFTLSSGAWQSGSANCTATLYYGGSKIVTLATLNFAVAA